MTSRILSSSISNTQPPLKKQKADTEPSSSISKAFEDLRKAQTYQNLITDICSIITPSYLSIPKDNPEKNATWEKALKIFKMCHNTDYSGELEKRSESFKYLKDTIKTQSPMISPDTGKRMQGILTSCIQAIQEKTLEQSTIDEYITPLLSDCRIKDLLIHIKNTQGIDEAANLAYLLFSNKLLQKDQKEEILNICKDWTQFNQHSSKIVDICIYAITQKTSKLIFQKGLEVLDVLFKKKQGYQQAKDFVCKNLQNTAPVNLNLIDFSIISDAACLIARKLIEHNQGSEEMLDATCEAIYVKDHQIQMNHNQRVRRNTEKLLIQFIKANHGLEKAISIFEDIFKQKQQQAKFRFLLAITYELLTKGQGFEQGKILVQYCLHIRIAYSEFKDILGHLIENGLCLDLAEKIAKKSLSGNSSLKNKIEGLELVFALAKKNKRCTFIETKMPSLIESLKRGYAQHHRLPDTKDFYSFHSIILDVAIIYVEKGLIKMEANEAFNVHKQYSRTIPKEINVKTEKLLLALVRTQDNLEPLQTAIFSPTKKGKRPRKLPLLNK